MSVSVGRDGRGGPTARERARKRSSIATIIRHCFTCALLSLVRANLISLFYGKKFEHYNERLDEHLAEM
jgi:hypothetical protein